MYVAVDVNDDKCFQRPANELNEGSDDYNHGRNEK